MIGASVQINSGRIPKTWTAEYMGYLHEKL